MLYLNKKSSLLEAVFLPHLFIQTGTRATPHVGGDFPVTPWLGHLPCVGMLEVRSRGSISIRPSIMKLHMTKKWLQNIEVKCYNIVVEFGLSTCPSHARKQRQRGRTQRPRGNFNADGHSRQLRSGVACIFLFMRHMGGDFT